jgi:hypothetical protein
VRERAASRRIANRRSGQLGLSCAALQRRWFKQRKYRNQFEAAGGVAGFVRRILADATGQNPPRRYPGLFRVLGESCEAGAGAAGFPPDNSEQSHAEAAIRPSAPSSSAGLDWTPAPADTACTQSRLTLPLRVHRQPASHRGRIAEPGP